MTSGQPHIRGNVVQGLARGRRLGFPTANVVPVAGSGRSPEGVWAGWIRWSGSPWRMTVVNIGQRPTFGTGGLAVEAHVLDYTGDLYGREVEVQLVQRLRPEQRFAGAAALMEQIDKDIAEARTLLTREPGPHNPMEGAQ